MYWPDPWRTHSCVQRSSLSGLMATQCSLPPISMPAAAGWTTSNAFQSTFGDAVCLPFLFAIYTPMDREFARPGSDKIQDSPTRSHVRPKGPRAAIHARDRKKTGLSLPSYPHPCRLVTWRVVSGARDRPQGGLSLVCTQHLHCLLARFLLLSRATPKTVKLPAATDLETRDEYAPAALTS